MFATSELHAEMNATQAIAGGSQATLPDISHPELLGQKQFYPSFKGQSGP
jgi:hypothetical protein